MNQAERDRRRREYVEAEAARLAGEFQAPGIRHGNSNTAGAGGGGGSGLNGRRMTPSPSGGVADYDDQEKEKHEHGQHQHLQSSPGATKRYFEVTCTFHSAYEALSFALSRYKVFNRIHTKMQYLIERSIQSTYILLD